MTFAKITILSGTRDELGGVDIAIANVFERTQRPGVLSGVLIVENQEKNVGVGDEFALGDGRFRLIEIREHHSGAYVFVFETVLAAPELTSKKYAISSICADQLVLKLKEHTFGIMALLGAKMEPDGWRKQTEQSIVADRNGKMGPNVQVCHRACFDDTAMEATIKIETIRWSANEIYRLEVSGFWRFETQSYHLFARGEKLEPITEFYANEMNEDASRFIVDIVCNNNAPT